MPKMYVSAVSTRFSRGMSTPAILAMRQILLALECRYLKERLTVCWCLRACPGQTATQTSVERGAWALRRTLNTCTRAASLCLALPLLMLGVLAADDHHDALAPDDLAVLAARLDRRSDFHRDAPHMSCPVLPAMPHVFAASSAETRRSSKRGGRRGRSDTHVGGIGRPAGVGEDGSRGPSA